MHTPYWRGRFFSYDDLGPLSKAQTTAAIMLDRLADDSGVVGLNADRIAEIAGVSRPRLSEAVAYLTSRGNVQRREPGCNRPGFVLQRTHHRTKSPIELAIERGEAVLRRGELVWLNTPSKESRACSSSPSRS